MKTSQRPISANGEAGSTSSLEDFRASLSVMPGSEEARRMTATSGRTCSAASTKSGPLGSWLRTLLASSRWSSRTRFLQWRVRELYSTRATEYEDTDSSRPLPCNASATTLRVTDTKSSRCLFQLVPLEPPTEETASSSSQGVLLQMPTSVQTDEPPEKMRARANRKGYKNGTKYGSLTSQIKYDPRLQTLLPTPTATDFHAGYSVEATKKNSAREHLLRNMKTMGGFWGILPTPRASGEENYETRAKKKGHAAAMSYLESAVDYLTKSETGGAPSRLSPLFT